MSGTLQSNVPSGSTTYRKTDKTNKDRLHWAKMLDAVGRFQQGWHEGEADAVPFIK